RMKGDWKAIEGAPPRGQPIAMLEETDRTPLLVTNTSVSRVVHDMASGPVMLRMPGFSLPISKAEALEEVGPSPAVYWADPSIAAIDQKTGRLFIYSRGTLSALVR